MFRRSLVVIPRSTTHLAKRLAQPFSKRRLFHIARVMGPTLVALSFAGAAHAQGTMDFSGAQTLMGTFNELEKYTQARIGGNNPAENTGKFIAAKFEHDTARPVDGYAAPQLHTHAVIFNVTERADGSTRALQERSFFESKQFATAVYQSELTYRLRGLGYEIETGRSGAPEIKGYTRPNTIIGHTPANGNGSELQSVPISFKQKNKN